MLEFALDKYKPVFTSYTPSFHNHHQYHPNPSEHGPFRPLGKLEYAQFLSKLTVKPGDFLVYPSASKCTDGKYSEWAIYYLVGIQEIHHQITNWGTLRSGPHILEVCNFLMNDASKLSSTWYAASNLYRAIPEEEVSPKFLEAVNAKFRADKVQQSATSTALTLVETKI